MPGVFRLWVGPGQPQRRRHNARAAIHEAAAGCGDQLHLQFRLQGLLQPAPVGQALTHFSFMIDGRPRLLRGLFVYHLLVPCPAAGVSNVFTWRCLSWRASARRPASWWISVSSVRAWSITPRSAPRPAAPLDWSSPGRTTRSPPNAALFVPAWSASPSALTD